MTELSPLALNLSSEHQLTEHYAQIILPFWQQSVIESQFTSTDNVTISYAYTLCPQAKATIVISPGRSEGYLKYQELIYDLVQQGYSVFIIDHRGQGLSDKLIDHPQKGYVADFQHYVDDLKHFYHEVVNAKTSDQRFLLGHSMGCTIATLYLQQYPDDFAAATMSAPMYGFNPGKVPAAVAIPLIRLLVWWKKRSNNSTDYFLDQGDYHWLPFEQNQLTHSEIRYRQFRQQNEDIPALKLGGITFHWLATSLNAIDQLYANLSQLKTPLLLLQAGEETIVSLAAQDKFCRLNGCEKLELADARHEILFEVDTIRHKAIGAMLAFFDHQLRKRLSACDSGSS
ncbi:MAG: lysophospholipase [Phenylobacterium sp.]|jgi:lysophospholipase